MAGHLVILCNIERIPTLDVTGTALGFGLNLTAAWSEEATAGALPHKDILKTWLWSRLDNIRYQWLKADLTAFGPAAETDLKRQPITLTTDDLKLLNARLEQEYDESAKRLTNLVWNPPTTQAAQINQNFNETQRRWHTILGQFSTYPFPFPQAFNISHLFRVPWQENADAVYLAVAPILKKTDAVFPTEDLTPNAGPTQTGGDKRVLKWEINTAGGVLKAVAYLSPCKRVLADKPDDFIQLTNQWIRRAPSKADTDKTTQFAEDWQARLELRLGEAFQLPLIILNYLRSLQEDKEDRSKTIKACVYLFLATLRDIAGIGAHPAVDPDSYPGDFPKVDGSRFAARLFRAYDNTITLNRAEWEEIESREKTVFDTSVKWKQFLQQKYAGELKAQGPNGEYLSSQVANLDILKDVYKHQSRLNTLAELERLAGIVFDSSEQDTLWVLFRAHWEAVLDKSSISQGKQDKIKAVLKKAASKDAKNIRFDLRQQLTLNNLDVFWHNFIRSNRAADDPQGHKLITVCFPAYLRYYLSERIELGSASSEPGCTLPEKLPRPFYPLIASGDLGDVKETVRGDLKKVITDVWSPKYIAELLPKAEVVQPTETPHAITIQMGKLESVPNESTGFSDPLREISGIGVLIHESGGPSWRILNMADVWTSHPTEEVAVKVKGQQTTVNRPKPVKLKLDEPVLVPFRVSYSGGLRQVCVSYNNQPLIGDSPLSHPNITNYELNQEGDKEGKVLTQYRYSRDELAKMVYLKFGRKYQLASFAIRNSGVLPTEIAGDYADDKTPCRVDSAKLRTMNPPADATHTVDYQRLVKVGALRLLNKDKDGKSKTISFEPSPIPAGVNPRARDLKIFESEEIPLLLLAPEEWGSIPATVEFHVKRPALSWECWDRWVAGEEVRTRIKDKEARKNILAELYRKMKENDPKNGANVEPTDLLLDDPATARLLHLQLFDESGKLLMPERTVVVPPPTGSGLQSEQCPPIRIKCEWTTSDEGLFELTETGNSGTVKVAGAHVKVKKGSVYKLVISACIPAEYIDDPKTQNRIAWFAAGIVKGVKQELEYDEGGKRVKNTFYLVSPKQLAIEAATDDLPKAENVRKALETAFLLEPELLPDRKQWTVAVNFGPGLKGARPRTELRVKETEERMLFRNIGRVELQRQVWRWQGRATKLHPDLEITLAADRDKKIQAWEGVEFGDRPITDQIASQMTMQTDEFQPKIAAQGFRCFEYKEVLQGGEGRDELRSLHFRFAVKAFNRYEPIMLALAEDKKAVATLDPNDIAGQWKYQFVPCRRQAPIPVPKIKLILPLTNSYGDGHKSSPGLLVVLNEPWHEIGGIGELLEAEVIMTPDPSKPLGEAKQGYFEVGPDPIISKDGRISTPFDFGSNKVNFDNAKIIGPVGHYFDRDNTSALFVGTSFILPAPNLPIDESKLGWYFAKVKFRRNVISFDANGETIYDPGIRRWKRRENKSEFTDPFWVQYLPEFSIYDDLQAAKLRMKVIGTNRIVLQKENGETAMPSAKGGNSSLYLVLTRIVFDVTGRPDQEQYLGLLAPADKTGWELRAKESIVSNIPSDPQGQYRARIIEVQRPTGHAASNEVSVWDELFKDEVSNSEDRPIWNRHDARARIVRISEPIEQEGRLTDCEEVIRAETKRLSPGSR